MAFQVWAEGAVADLPSGARGYLVLVAADDGEPRSQLAIARQLGIDRTIMTYLVDALVEQHLIERHLDAHNRRVRPSSSPTPAVPPSRRHAAAWP
jgi:hypothetical protein